MVFRGSKRLSKSLRQTSDIYGDYLTLLTVDKTKFIFTHSYQGSTNNSLETYPASRGPSILLDKSGRRKNFPDLSGRIEGPLLAGH